MIFSLRNKERQPQLYHSVQKMYLKIIKSCSTKHSDSSVLIHFFPTKTHI